MSKPKPITTRGLHNLTQQLADLLVERLGMDAIRKAAERDRQQGIYDLIRPELPSGVTNREVWDVTYILTEGARPAPLPFGVPASSYSVYLEE